MPKRMIEISYNHQSDMSKAWVSGSQRFTDWFGFADWLKQMNEAGKAVLITEWKYVQCQPIS